MVVQESSQNEPLCFIVTSMDKGARLRYGDVILNRIPGELGIMERHNKIRIGMQIDVELKNQEVGADKNNTIASVEKAEAVISTFSIIL